MSSCAHTSLCYGVSSHAEEVGYIRTTAQRRTAATQPSGRVPIEHVETTEPVSSSTFPAPLVLPGDELSWNPKYPPQSLRSWMQQRYRNVVTQQRRTIYVVGPPAVEDEMSHLLSWTISQTKTQVVRPKVDDLISYLGAFYHNMPVKMLESSDLRFTAWEGSTSSGRRIRKCNKPVPDVGLKTGSGVTYIRSRKYDGCYQGQLNLNDLLDVAIRILPDDAYALLLFVDHDIYEDREDDFCCGRAYGGSRVAVVSSARYNPALDDVQNVERVHAWPASHCSEYMREQCDDSRATKKHKRGQKTPKLAAPKGTTAMQAAVAAAVSHDKPPRDAEQWLTNLWLGRICKTAAHELGHCFGMDHCIYYGCLMQGTAGLSEDARQPPFFCPVDTVKLLTATGAPEQAWLQELLRFCRQFEDDRLFSASVAWLEVRLNELTSHKTLRAEHDETSGGVMAGFALSEPID